MPPNTLDFAARVERLNAYIAEGRVIRGLWREDGGERACLLVAMYPETDENSYTFCCEPDVLPSWFRVLMPPMNDLGTEAAWPEMIQRFGTLMQRVHVLTEDDWRRLDYATRRIALDVALPRAGKARSAVQAVRDLCMRVERGGAVLPWEWTAATAAACGAASAAANPAAKAAARAAAEAAARVGAGTVSLPLALTVSLVATWSAASSGAPAAAWDRITSELLAAIEAACTAAEPARRRLSEADIMRVIGEMPISDPQG